jgi:hypothetical protein
MRNRRFNSDEVLRKLERRVQESMDRAAVIALARLYERQGVEKPFEIWAAMDSTPYTTEIMSVWFDKADAEREVARLYVDNIQGDGRDPLVAYEESDAEDPLDFDEGEEPPPVTKQEVLDAWEANDHVRVIDRAAAYVRRSQRTKNGFSFEVAGPFVVDKPWEPRRSS